MRMTVIKKNWLSILVMISFLGLGEQAQADDGIVISSQPDIDQGKEIYQAHCLECHGTKGNGDGPRAATLAFRPGTLVSPAMENKTDDELLVIIAEGIPQTAMQGWNDRLSVDDRRNVLAYVRSLAFSP